MKKLYTITTLVILAFIASKVWNLFFTFNTNLFITFISIVVGIVACEVISDDERERRYYPRHKV